MSVERKLQRGSSYGRALSRARRALLPRSVDHIYKRSKYNKNGLLHWTSLSLHRVNRSTLIPQNYASERSANVDDFICGGNRHDLLYGPVSELHTFFDHLLDLIFHDALFGSR